MANKYVIINNFRIDFSTHDYELLLNNDFKYKYFIKKIFNLNNFIFFIDDYKIDYTLFYLSPFQINKNIYDKIKFDNSFNKIIDSLCKKIFIDNSTLINKDYMNLKNIIKKKYKFNNYITMKETFLILWYIIIKDKYILKSKIDYFLNLIKYYYSNFISNNLDFCKIIFEIENSDNLEKIKLLMGLYILSDEFHYKYIKYWISTNLRELDGFIINANYLKINPQEILNNIQGQFYPDKINLLENINCPYGHNILFFINKNKIYYYDSDEQILSDYIKLKYFFKNIGIIFLNISTRNPIQLIFDDGNCVFYCLRFIEYLSKFKVKFDLRTLQKFAFKYENMIINDNDMFNWIYNFVKKFKINKNKIMCL